MKVNTEAQRLKQVRAELKMTQPQFGQYLGISTTYDMERGKTKISGEIVYKLLKDHNINPLWLYGESDQKYLNPKSKSVSPSVVTVDNLGFENILMVNEKAAAGYAGNLNNQDYHEQLPAFSFPIPEYRNATFRCFQVEGYSMYPTIQPNEWIITKAVEDLSQIKNNNIYVVVDTDGIRIKQVHNEVDMKYLVLISINQEYEIETVKYDDVMEVWEYHSKITKELQYDDKDKLNSIYNDIKLIKERLIEE